MPSWKKVITSGSNAALQSLTVTNGATVSSSLTLSGSINNVDYIDFNTSYTATQPVAGRLSWNNSDGTLDLGMKGGNVTQQIGEEIFYEVRNETGTPISNGTLLYANGVTAGGGRITAAPYTADGSVREVRLLGMATEDISNGVNGFVTHFGYVRDLDTRGTSASSIAVGDETWAVGDILYAHPTVAGKLTNVKPKHEISVAIIIIRHASTGVVFTRPISYGHLDDIHDVNINTGSLSTGDLLIYDSGSDYWINSKQLSGSYGLTGSLNITGGGVTGSLFGTASFALTASFLDSTTNAFLQNGNSFGTTALLGTNDNQSLALETNGTTKMFISSSGNVGIGTTTPSQTLEVNGNALIKTAFIGTVPAFGDNYTSFSHISRTGSDDYSLLSDNAGTTYINAKSNQDIRFRIDNLDKAFLSSSGDFGIGTTTPNAKLDVNGNTIITGSLTVTQGITGSLFGTASWAQNALTASFATTAATASFVNPLNQNVVITGSLTVSGSTGTVFNSNVDTLVLTGSLLVTGSTVLTGPLTVGISNIRTNTITPSAAGANTVFTQATGSFTGAKYLYTVTSASNARTGEVMAVWNGTTTQYTDNSTLDIGSTTAVTASVSIVTAQAQFNMQTTNAGWTIKSQVTYL
jgi:hypothetical protein